MSPLLLAILAYVALQLVLGVIVSRRIRTEEDYLVAGRRLGMPLATLSVFATWFGAETCVGAAGAVYENGLSAGSADPFGYAICLLLMGLFFAARLWRGRYLTLGDVYRERYSPGVERLLVVLLVPTSLLWAAAQIRAFGQVLDVSSGIGLGAGIAIATGVVILYTASGGLLADAVTDFLQGIVLTLGLAWLGWVVFTQAGGGAALAAIEPARLNPLARGRPALEVAEAWLVPILGSLTAQELASRVLASRSARIAQRATLLASGLYLAVGLIPVAIGLAGPRLLPGLADPETLLPRLAMTHFHTAGYVIFAGALVSAILSTVDSNLLSVGALTTHNGVLRLWPDAGERVRVAVTRGGVVIAGLIAAALASSNAGVYGLVEQASAFGGAGLIVVMAFALFTRFGGTRAAFASLLGGMVVQLAGTYLVRGFAWPFTASLFVSLVLYVGVGAFGERAAVAGERR